MGWRRWWIVLAACLLGGCSAVQFTYGLGPRLAHGWLDRYADFESDQSGRAREAVDAWFAWHRRDALPDYADELAAIRARAHEPWTAAQVCEQVVGWRRRLHQALERGVPLAAPLLRTLDARQIAHIAERQADTLKQWREEHGGDDPAERRQRLFEQRLERAEQLYGALDERQRAWLRTAVSADADGLDVEAVLAQRRARQQRFIERLTRWTRAQSPDAVIAAELRADLTDWLAPADPVRAAQARRQREAGCALTAGLHDLTTPAQRAHAAETLGAWERDLRALAASPS